MVVTIDARRLFSATMFSARSRLKPRPGGAGIAGSSQLPPQPLVSRTSPNVRPINLNSQLRLARRTSYRLVLDAQGKGGQQSFAPTYACRPPGVHHGPFTSRSGCILHEIHYYQDAQKR